jgi:HSP20 family molecular chaperone IbpA
LIISGERKRKRDDRREGVYWPERFCGSLMQTIPIHDEAHVATATFENEILTVLLQVPSSGPSHRLSARVWADLERAEELT